MLAGAVHCSSVFDVKKQPCVASTAPNHARTGVVSTDQSERTSRPAAEYSPAVGAGAGSVIVTDEPPAGSK